MNIKAIKYHRIKRQAPEKEPPKQQEPDPASLTLAQRVWAARQGK